MNVLVVGGAGYIGSHMVKYLHHAGHRVVVVDNLSTGYAYLARYGELHVGDIGDIGFIESLFRQHNIEAVMHFAANSLVGESSINPAKYYQNNVGKTLHLLDAMLRNDIRYFVFSSTAAVFGEPEYTPIDEKHPKRPINPYGKSKLMVEQVLEDYAAAYGFASVCLRYFNACGADPQGEMGECHSPETHLIPLILQAATGERSAITIYGDDYPTEDGTCIRDYIHVNDLCAAHLLALEKMTRDDDDSAKVYNLGNGNGYSVREVIDAVKGMVENEGYRIHVMKGERRTGDPAVLVADAEQAMTRLGWKPEFTSLSSIIGHAWNWHKKQRNRHE